MSEPTRLTIVDTAQITPAQDARSIEMMHTGGVMLVPQRMTDQEIDELRPLLGEHADIRRSEAMPSGQVAFYSHTQAIKYGLLPNDRP